MQAQHATRLSELQYTILSEIPDAVLITDTEHHIVYWNGAAEKLYGLDAEQTLGRRLDACCPELWNSVAAAGQEFMSGLTSSAGKWSGEIGCRNHRGEALIFRCWVSVLRRRHNAPRGLVWILRDLTEQRRLERELCRCVERLNGGQAKEKCGPGTDGADPVWIQTPAVANEKGRDVVLWAEDSDDDAALLARAWLKAEVNDRLIRVHDGTEVIQYLNGDGVFANRNRYPVPSLVLLDLRMPGTNGLDVIAWMKHEERFQRLPVVILTASSSSCDVSEAARLGVKGYLVKPADPAEWVVKVKTVTSQCR